MLATGIGPSFTALRREIGRTALAGAGRCLVRMLLGLGREQHERLQIKDAAINLCVDRFKE
jgi:hypothetical protein